METSPLKKSSDGNYKDEYFVLFELPITYTKVFSILENIERFVFNKAIDAKKEGNADWVKVRDILIPIVATFNKSNTSYSEYCNLWMKEFIFYFVSKTVYNVFHTDENLEYRKKKKKLTSFTLSDYTHFIMFDKRSSCLSFENELHIPYKKILVGEDIEPRLFKTGMKTGLLMCDFVIQEGKPLCAINVWKKKV